MKHKTLPIYCFAYSIEFVQFVFADRNKVTKDVVDHTNSTRTHAEFLANEIAAEGKQSENIYGDSIYDDLIEYLTLDTVYYYSQISGTSMPNGYLEEEVYFIYS